MRRSKLTFLLVMLSVYLLVCLLVFLFQEKLIFFPEKLAADFVFDYEMPYQERVYDMADGASIHALFFSRSEAKGLVYYLHGNAGSLRTWGRIAIPFLEAGYAVLIIDYRGYGKSRGRLSQAALLSDALSVYGELVEEFSTERIIVYGRSIGCALAVHVAASQSPRQLILEAPFYSMKDLARRLYPILPAFLLRYPLRIDLKFPQVSCRITIFHGSEDEMVYYGSSLKLMKHAKEGDRLVTISGGGHNNLDEFPQYRQALMKVLQ